MLALVANEKNRDADTDQAERGERWMGFGEANKVAFKVWFVMPLSGVG